MSRHIDVGLEIWPGGRMPAHRSARSPACSASTSSFDRVIQNFLGIFREEAFRVLAASYPGL